MKKTIFIMFFLLILVFTFTSCKSNVSSNDSQIDNQSNVFLDANGSSTNTDEEPSSTITNIVDDWNKDTISIEITSSKSVEPNEDTSLIDSSNSKDTVTNKPQYENSSNTVLNESQTEDSNNTISNDSQETNLENDFSNEQDDNTSSVISVPEYYEGRY